MGKPLTLVLVQDNDWKDVIEKGLSGNIVKDGPNKGKAVWIAEAVGAWNYFDISSTLKEHFGQQDSKKPTPGIIFQSSEKEGFSGTFSNEFFESYASALFHQAAPESHIQKPWEETAPIQVAGWKVDEYFKKPTGQNFDDLVKFLNTPVAGTVDDGDTNKKNDKTVEQTYQNGDRETGNYFYQNGIPENILVVMNSVLRQKIAKYVGKQESEIPVTFEYDKNSELLIARKR